MNLGSIIRTLHLGAEPEIGKSVRSSYSLILFSRIDHCLSEEKAEGGCGEGLWEAPSHVALNPTSQPPPVDALQHKNAEC